MNGRRCGTWELGSCSGSAGMTFSIPGEREPLLRDAVSEEQSPTYRRAGNAEAALNLYYSQLYRSQSFAESAELAAEMEKAQLREMLGNAQKGS